jgi:hypothetical protein
VPLTQRPHFDRVTIAWIRLSTCEYCAGRPRLESGSLVDPGLVCRQGEQSHLSASRVTWHPKPKTLPLIVENTIALISPGW